MRAFWNSCFCLGLGALLLSGCDLSHGRPGKDSETLAPDEILDFKTLYAENCAGCHGMEGHGGAAIALANPVYLAIADEAAMRAQLGLDQPIAVQYVNWLGTVLHGDLGHSFRSHAPIVQELAGLQSTQVVIPAIGDGRNQGMQLDDIGQ